MMHYITDYQDYLKHWKTLKGKTPLKASYSEVRCKRCNSNNIIKYGHFKNMQRWWCKDCQRKFADNSALPGMRTPIDQIAQVLSMYYEGMSLKSIRRLLSQDYGNYPSDSTIWKWVYKFANKAKSETSKYIPEIKDIWLVKDTVLKINGRDYRIIDVQDVETRFLLATNLTSNQSIRGIRHALESAHDKAGKIPQKLILDGRRGYVDVLKLAYGEISKHIQVETYNDEENYSDLVEHWQNILKDRKKFMHTLKDKKSMQMILDRWQIHYNFFRIHDELAGKTPAEKAGIKFKSEASQILPIIHYK